ncbi:hypothetical protein J2X47_000557 [Sphingomonas sp. BE270]|uniref:hypothetical protein n=1 Tax=Sphingomonas sp. BE270 TaxID=2817726 RepID=UPI0028553554|nr:hypothetical protein [Sphingomonas sp. BE270]MDR7256396.1 hypothetical protein [Sphingomonas sp. BE270]
MSAANLYRQHAAAQRAAANKESLPRRRQQHVRSAERWDEMAQAAEETDRRAAVNEAEKRERPYHQTLRYGNGG